MARIPDAPTSPLPRPTDDIPAFRTALGDWFARHARDLPWRRTQDPYAIVVSEFMLQQTQVKTVLPYFARWLEAFPGFADLAAASEEQVLAQWQGLGYYSRARSLHRLARAVVEGHPDGFPRDPAAIRALPGIGPYTAGAIAAFAYDVPAPAVDGNITRVLARLFNVRDPVDTSAGQARIWELAAAILPLGPGGGREQVGAIMELGATVCLARRPLCLLCPVNAYCAGRAVGGVEELPLKKARPRPEQREQHALWMPDAAGRVLLQQAPGPLWKGMWHLPLVEEAPGRAPLVNVVFGITRYRVALGVYAVETVLDREYVPFYLEPPRKPSPRVNLAWHDRATLNELPMPAPHRKVLGLLAELPR